jgi:hypothetical protein
MTRPRSAPTSSVTVRTIHRGSVTVGIQSLMVTELVWRAPAPVVAGPSLGDIRTTDEDRDAGDEDARRRQNRYWARGVTIALSRSVFS